jgi:hypothetical protein
LVRAAFLAAAERELALRRLAAERACVESERGEAADDPSCFNALVVARDRVVDVSELFFRRVVLLRRAFFAAAPFLGSLTPALRASDSPMAMACFVERAPCFPPRMWCISSRTNSPAWVDGDFPSRASSRARLTVR